jgi:predicted metalloprotease with PDZ domain
MIMRVLATALLCLSSSTFVLAQQTIRETLAVDATDAPRNILHATVTIPVSSGAQTIVYPKWMPGNHRPTGPIQNLTGLHFEASGQELPWQRDLVDMWAFHLQVPAGVKELKVTLDTITYNGKNSLASSKVLDLLWNQVILYPQGTATDSVTVTASVRLPQGWKFGTALTEAQGLAQGATEFQPVTLTKLVDSPLIAGQYYRLIPLTPEGEKPQHVIDMVGESEDAMAMPAQDLANYKKLVAEAYALFGARHYEKYHFLWTLSDQTAHHGLEHHESSDNATGEDVFHDPNAHNLEADLLPHEYTHSWNGKHRRPAGLATANYQEPMKGDLLWVYEGMTDYWGAILAARVGLRSPDQFRENLAATAAMLDHRVGRTWRPLQDTATSVQILYASGGQWVNWRRSVDYYPEGYLIWLDVDTQIRRLSNGQKSLNDFCRSFYGGQSGPPTVVTYKFEDVVSGLNQVVAHDWAKFLRDRLDSKSPHAPLGGIENGGWKLIYNDQKNTTVEAQEKTANTLDMSFSIGAIATKDGDLRDVIPGTPAFAALKAAMNSKEPIAILAENGDYYNTYNVDYHGGEKYPHLVRNEGQTDLLGEIIKPLTK